MKVRDLALGTIGVYSAFRLMTKMRRRISFEGRTVMITGGSRGLGLVIARQLARQGARLILVARDLLELDRAARQIEELGAEVLAVSADVTDQVEVDIAVMQAIDRFGAIDVLINDAGVIQIGPLEHMTIDDFERSMNVNFWGALHAIASVLPGMRERGFGRVVNISSIGGEVAVPHMIPYTASKFALAGFSEALRAEVAKDNVWVTTVCPTLMRTGSGGNAEFKGRAEDEYAWFTVAGSLPGLTISAERAAARIIRACRYGDAHTFVSPIGRALSVFTRIAPELSADILGLINRRLLPPIDEDGDVLSHFGYELKSPVDQSVITRLTRRAALENNEARE